MLLQSCGYAVAAGFGTIGRINDGGRQSDGEFDGVKAVWHADLLVEVHGRRSIILLRAVAINWRPAIAFLSEQFTLTIYNT